MFSNIRLRGAPLICSLAICAFLISNSIKSMEMQVTTNLCHANQKIILKRENKIINVFIGTGLWSNKYELTVGLPIDILNMIITAQLLRRQIEKNIGNKSGLIILIADHLAIESGADINEVNNRVEQNLIILNCILKKLGINEFKIVLSSAVVKEPEYQEIYKSLINNFHIKQLENKNRNYAITQTAIGRYMQIFCMALIKISWAHKFQKKSDKFDELWFDQIYINIFGPGQVNFIYTKAGIAFQKENGGTRVPYTHTPIKDKEKDMRVLFYDPKNKMVINAVDMKKMTKTAITHYRNIIEGLSFIGCKFLTLKNNETNFDKISADLNSIINLSYSAFISSNLLGDIILVLPNAILELIIGYI